MDNKAVHLSITFLLTAGCFKNCQVMVLLAVANTNTALYPEALIARPASVECRFSIVA